MATVYSPKICDTYLSLRLPGGSRLGSGSSLGSRRRLRGADHLTRFSISALVGRVMAEVLPKRLDVHLVISMHVTDPRIVTVE